MKIKMFTTGGTIDKTYFDANSAFQVGDPQIVGLLEQANASFDFEVESLLRKDSLDLTDCDRQLIYDRIMADPCDRILVTHGTDTMTQTARMLRGIADKTIVLTGAMQPARVRMSDAEFNIGYAIAAVQLLPAGVFLAMQGQVFEPGKVRKNRDRQRFEETGE